MHVTTDLQTLMQRTRASEFRDGLDEITVGILFSLVSLAIVALRGSPPEAGPIGAVALAVLIQAANWGITQFRLRWIWPRTGYAKFERSFYRRYQVASLALILVAVVALMAFLVVVTGHTNRIVALTLALGLFSIGQWKYFGQTRAFIAALVVTFVALIATVLPVSADSAFLTVSLSFGLCMLVGGIYALIHLLRGIGTEQGE